MERRFGELEALGSVDEVLKGYDSRADRWRFSFESPFWKAVRHAHGRDRRGKGSRIAIVDSGCNRSIPRLAKRVDTVRQLVPGSEERDPLGHGTVVGLLISEVAPECRFDVYRVAMDDGRVDLHATIKAIGEAAESGATIINLSLGDRQDLVPPSEPLEPGALSFDPSKFSKASYFPEEPPCQLCQAARAAAHKGKLVFAAVGNSIIETYCPSRISEVFAVGFQRTVNIDLPGGRQIATGWPALTESPYADLFIKEIPGVLGSSFACPLHAGVAALGASESELRQYIAAIEARGFPQRHHAQIDQVGGPTKVPREMAMEVDRRYVEALRKLPHVHSTLQHSLRPDLPLTDPADCVLCGFFAESTCVTAGLWLCETQRYDQAISLLDAVRAFAPWSAQASFHLGLTYHVLGDGPRALKNYQDALTLRPDYPDALARLRILLGK